MGTEYRGMVNVTSSKLPCQRWDSDYPHQHSDKKTKLPNAGLDMNYCRNPNRDSLGPWCYTTSQNKRWEYCDVEFCCKLMILFSNTLFFEFSRLIA